MVELISLLDKEISIKVSSSLEKSTGKKNLIDNSPETCWASQQGLPQFIQLGFPNRVIPKRLSIVFQGGFVGTRCAVCISGTNANTAWQILSHIYPEDVNRRQNFDLVPTQPEMLEGGVSSVKLVFEESSDFFGRITVYDLKLEDKICSESLEMFTEAADNCTTIDSSSRIFASTSSRVLGRMPTLDLL